MKLHITLEDIASLEENQRLHLSELWRPQKYDLAAAKIYTDVENDQYDFFEFVIGKVDIFENGAVVVHDLCSIKEQENALSDKDELDEDWEAEEDFESDLEDFEFENVRPTSFVRSDCIPLLNIGQMIDILERTNFSFGDFYVTATIDDIGCTLGKNLLNMDDYKAGYDQKELCDVLWEQVKQAL